MICGVLLAGLTLLLAGGCGDGAKAKLPEMNVFSVAGYGAGQVCGELRGSRPGPIVLMAIKPNGPAMETAVDHIRKGLSQGAGGNADIKLSLITTTEEHPMPGVRELPKGMMESFRAELAGNASAAVIVANLPPELLGNLGGPSSHPPIVVLDLNTNPAWPPALSAGSIQAAVVMREPFPVQPVEGSFADLARRFFTTLRK